MNRVFHIVLPGSPHTKLRPRFAKRKGKTRTYDAQAEDKETVRWQLKARTQGQPPPAGPLRVTMEFVFVRPNSRAKLNEYYHTVKPDLDNLIKFYGDAGNGVLWQDDAKISTIAATKRYGAAAATIIIVETIDAERAQEGQGPAPCGGALPDSHCHPGESGAVARQNSAGDTQQDKSGC